MRFPVPGSRRTARGMLVVLGLCSFGAGAGTAQTDPAGDPGRTEAVRADTTRADSARARVLESLGRIVSTPTPRQLLLDGDSAFLEQIRVRREQSASSPSAAGGGAQTPDSVLGMLSALAGYSTSSYEAVRAEYEAGSGELLLLSAAGWAGRAAPAGPEAAASTDSLAAPTDSLAAGDSLATGGQAAAPPPTGAPEVEGGEPSPPTGLPEPGGAPPEAGAGLRPEGPPTAPGAEAFARGEAEPSLGGGRPARLLFDGREILADSAILYSERDRRVVTRGKTRSQDRTGDPLESSFLVYDLEEGRGTALDARTRYQETGGEWIVLGDANAVYPGEAWLHDAMFTSCDLEVPHSHFGVDEIKVMSGGFLVARPVRLYFADVPVLWLPFIAQSIAGGRASGLLTPQFSLNDIVRNSQGYARRISNLGFYWAVNEYADASVGLDWFSDNFTALTGTMGYRWSRQFLDGSVSVRQYWREEGGKELAFDTRHRWEYDERTKFDMSARYASSSDFVRRNSFDPREITQSIDSDGGFSRRFDWGTVSLSANRRQFLSDDRVEQTLPSLNLTLQPITFLRAPAGRERFWNNLTWSGSGSFSERSEIRAPQPADSFRTDRADRGSRQARLTSSLSLGNLSISQSASLSEQIVRRVPFLPVEAGGVLPGAPLPVFTDIGKEEVQWSSSLSYQQQLIGSTTLTPALSVTGSALRDEAEGGTEGRLVSAPARLSLSVGLRSDLYAFFPGFGGFDAIRHKVSPSFDYNFSPAVRPTDLQRQTFRSTELRAQRTLSIGFNQTFEARRRASSNADSAATPAPGTGEEAGSASGEGAREDVSGGSAGVRAVPDPASEIGGGTGPRRRERQEIVKLLGLQTSAIAYDFSLADSLGGIRGFTTTELSTQITSDYLRGLNLSLQHQVFDDEALVEGGARRFAPFLTSVAFGFSLDSSSSLLRRLGLSTGSASAAGGGDARTDPGGVRSGFDGGAAPSVVPGRGGASGPGGGMGPRRGGGGWNANFSYSLRRSRSDPQRNSQMLQVNSGFSPTPAWDVSWQTSYDVEAGGFNDHMISLRRDLHEWEATFDFLQTATGNWSFRFNVALVANPDLKFDYQQRNPGFSDRDRRGTSGFR